MVVEAAAKCQSQQIIKAVQVAFTFCEAAGAGQGALMEPSDLYCNCFWDCGVGVGVEGCFGDASTEVAAAGVERCGIAGDGGGGIAFAVGVLRCAEAGVGVEAGFAKALGFLCHSFNLAAEMRSLTKSLGASGTLSSRASYLICLAVRVS